MDTTSSNGCHTEESSQCSLPPLLDRTSTREVPLPSQGGISRPHPPLFSGDYGKIGEPKSKERGYWWESPTLDVQKQYGRRVLQGMYYGEQRDPRCNVCEVGNHACMSFVGEDKDLVGCVRCSRKHKECSQAKRRSIINQDVMVRLVRYTYT